MRFILRSLACTYKCLYFIQHSIYTRHGLILHFFKGGCGLDEEEFGWSFPKLTFYFAFNVHTQSRFGVATAMKGLVLTAALTLMPNVIICMVSPRHQVKKFKTLSASPIQSDINPPFLYMAKQECILHQRSGPSKNPEVPNTLATKHTSRHG